MRFQFVAWIRRTWSRAAMIGLLAGCCGSADAAPADTRAWLKPQRLAEGVYVLPGDSAAPDSRNLGRVGNLGFLVGQDGVVVIDTGSSSARAKELMAAMAEVTAARPTVALITHPAQEFLFGNADFADLGVPVYAQADTPRLMAQRCDHCLETLRHDLGATRMAGTRLVLPQALPFATGAVVLAGRHLTVTAGPAGTVPGNLLIRDDATGVMFAGALLSVGRVPNVQDTRPLAWRDALRTLDDPAIRAVVPAYGPVVWREPAAGSPALADAMAALAGYLGDLEARAQELYRAGVALPDLDRRGELPAYRDWSGYQPNHLHNIFYRYLQLEAEDLAGQ